MTNTDQTSIEHFMHTQVHCWNSGDKDGFFAAYKSIAPEVLTIEYVGTPSGDGWTILDGMWAQQQPKITIEEVALIVVGKEAVAHNRNNIKGTNMAIETIEHYRFDADGSVHVRYFIKQPSQS
ncbi:nuclear transport factor 2 family protein [Aestuariicella hydrocarbonica]|uniref:Nuclear transport factor 2 family protein n=1 Tax=Pseudomaricurvus hydrocarbonicus TaxID=1470433 RepID=A0A9E5K0X9_9GAMM|nr:nuclear transport factor 2 family protein [Aestuariicella hydrocarbonica]NHO66707.1 nuclear transport factor 2 family protein [Aestuariicella hydrocarbonica]